MMLDAGLGMSPGDALFAGIAWKTGLTVGTVILLSSLVFIIVSWLLGLRPGIGTAVCFLAIGAVVDLTRLASNVVEPELWGLFPRILWWTLGLLIFSSGVIGLFAANLGASPYDQIVRSLSHRLHFSLGLARLLVDGIAITAAFILGGAWGVGTIVLLVTVPFILSFGVPPVSRYIHGRDPTLNNSLEQLSGQDSLET